MKIKGSTQSAIWKLCRLEFIGTGLYHVLSERCRKHRELSYRLKDIGDDECRHGHMFGNYYEKHYGKGYNKGFWIRIGRCMGHMVALVPLKWVLKVLHKMEADAEGHIREAHEERPDDPILPLLRAILNDEIKHAQLYGLIYGGNSDDLSI